MKKLVRSNSQQMAFGVLGGIAEYFNIDATILRLVFAIAFIFSGGIPLALIYIIAIFIIPNERDSYQ
ncbi:PspC domain-containing protein [Aquibacillus halophilus]|uniref:PspC domain-containing protein n=1 Tax=Aquibacillus halophilus TaxID=930132 RepID=A0A6A8DL67_9BACI|nr:PspC domain-containing protein [Aquibacillus halophilus]MRH42002.1 PspC domain-containing protein [Aquibacillus halophilus]